MRVQHTRGSRDGARDTHDINVHPGPEVAEHGSLEVLKGLAHVVATEVIARRDGAVLHETLDKGTDTGVRVKEQEKHARQQHIGDAALVRRD